MQQEDDLKGLSQVVHFMRGLSILILIVHFYWYNYHLFEGLG